MFLVVGVVDVEEGHGPDSSYCSLFPIHKKHADGVSLSQSKVIIITLYYTVILFVFPHP